MVEMNGRMEWKNGMEEKQKKQVGVSVLVSKMLPMRLEAGGRTFKINCETKGV